MFVRLSGVIYTRKHDRPGCSNAGFNPASGMFLSTLSQVFSAFKKSAFIQSQLPLVVITTHPLLQCILPKDEMAK